MFREFTLRSAAANMLHLKPFNFSYTFGTGAGFRTVHHTGNYHSDDVGQSQLTAERSRSQTEYRQHNYPLHFYRTASASKPFRRRNRQHRVSARPVRSQRTNAQATQMTAVFWIETVQVHILVGPLAVGQQFAVEPARVVPGQRVPTFSGIAPYDVDMPRKLTVTFTQIQYTQTVLLNFNGLTWPHVSVNTLVPADDIPVPASAW